jgi:ATP-dependent RNA helicase SUPV3L1/SUV3
LLFADEHLPAELRERVQRRLDTWMTNRIATRLEPLLALRTAADAKPGTARALPSEARGTAHQLCEALGSLDRTRATLPPDLRVAMRALRSFGVKFGRRAVFMPKLLRPDAASLLALLWGVRAKLDQIPSPPTAGITSFDADDAAPDGFLAAAGFHVVGPRAIRLDMLDRLEQELEAAATTGQVADAAVPKLVSLLGCDRATLDDVLAALGWSRVAVVGKDATATVWRQSVPRAQSRRRRTRTLPAPRHSPDSPFAGLAALIAAD